MQITPMDIAMADLVAQWTSKLRAGGGLPAVLICLEPDGRGSLVAGRCLDAAEILRLIESAAASIRERN